MEDLGSSAGEQVKVASEESGRCPDGRRDPASNHQAPTQYPSYTGHQSQDVTRKSQSPIFIDSQRSKRSRKRTRNRMNKRLSKAEDQDLSANPIRIEVDNEIQKISTTNMFQYWKPRKRPTRSFSAQSRRAPFQ